MIKHMGVVQLYLFSLSGDCLNMQNGLIEPLTLKNKFMKFLKNNWFKILAIIFLLWALTDNPYSYYQFLRWAILVVGAYSAYLAYDIGKKLWTWIFGIIAVLFNPIIPFYLSRNTWQPIDFIVAIIFFVSLFQKNERKN